MKKIVYPPLFMRLWNSFDAQLGPKGGKYPALLKFRAAKITEEDMPEILYALNRQKMEKYAKKARGEFYQFRQVKTWIFNRGWEDEVSSVVQEIQETDVIKRLTDRRWAK